MDSAKPIMEELKILDVFNLNTYQTCIFMFKFTKKLLPPTFDLLFEANQSTRYNLRINYQEKYRLPKNSCKYIEHSIAFRGPKLWNSIYQEIKKSTKSKYL